MEWNTLMNETYPKLNDYKHILSLEGEEWRDIVGFEGTHQVSNYGRVKRLELYSIKKNQFCSWNQKFESLVYSVHNDSRGYPQVIIILEGKKRVARVHRLVAEAFLAPPSKELIVECLKVGLPYVLVNHKDENICNPNFRNLEWCTPTYNNRYGSEKTIGNPKVSGESSYWVVLTESQVSEIVEILKSGTMSQEKIAERYGVKQITISNIWTGRSWAWFTGIERTKRTRRSENMSKPLVST